MIQYSSSKQVMYLMRTYFALWDINMDHDDVDQKYTHNNNIIVKLLSPNDAIHQRSHAG